MVKVSHARCRQCGQTRHRNAKANLCRRCWLVRKPEIEQGWRDIKARRAQKRNGVTHVEEAELIVAAAVEQVLEEDSAMPRGGRPSSLTPDQEQEIVSLYTTTDTPVHEIAETYGIGETSPFRILNKHGVAWRRGDTSGRVLPPHIEAMKEVHVAPNSTPAPQPEPTRIRESVPAQPDAQAAVPMWRIEFSGAFDLAAASFDDAVTLARELGARDITLVRRLA